jgi:anti-sigma regulatory factor (Ser/Thr protein kinase)
VKPTYTIPIPDVLRRDVSDIENVYSLVASAPPEHCYQFDLRSVTFIEPHGVIALIIGARHLVDRSGQRVHVTGIPSTIHAYLRRMNFFTAGQRWLWTTDICDEEAWSRSSKTPNLLELTTMASSKNLEYVLERAETIFCEWLPDHDVRSLQTVMTELCTNIYTHSYDQEGCVLIQKYSSETRHQVIVRIGVGDMGIGISESLQRRHGQIGQSPGDYLDAALQGRSARRERGGMGLRTIEDIVEQKGGYFWLRSDSAVILSHGYTKRQRVPNLADFSGTQIAVELFSPLLPS